jgi:L-gulonolactone oxidase
VAGSGHSFPPVVSTGDALVSLEDYTGVVEVDTETAQATVKAGTTLHDLNQTLADHGLAMANLGDIDAQTVAGAISTGTHGTGIDLGVLSTQVAKLRLVRADGETVELTPADGDPFRAAQVSLGALGVVSEVTLDLVPAYDLELHARPMPIEACLADLDRLRSENRHVEFFWFPHTDTAFVKTMNETDAERTGSGGDFDSRVENVAWEAMCRLSTAVPATTPWMSRLAAASFSEERSVGPSHEQFAHDRAVRFTESEWSVPVDAGPEVVREIRSWIDRTDADVCFPVEFRYVGGDDIPLSPAYGRDSAFVAAHKYHRKAAETYFDAVGSICGARDGRPHWGKRHEYDADDLAPRYPEWDTFHAVRREFDPEGLFLNDHLRGLFEGQRR